MMLKYRVFHRTRKWTGCGFNSDAYELVEWVNKMGIKKEQILSLINDTSNQSLTLFYWEESDDNGQNSGRDSQGM